MEIAQMLQVAGYVFLAVWLLAYSFAVVFMFRECLKAEAGERECECELLGTIAIIFFISFFLSFTVLYYSPLLIRRLLRWVGTSFVPPVFA